MKLQSLDLPNDIVRDLSVGIYNLRLLKTTIYGREITFPRRMDWYGDVAYRFSNMTITQSQQTPYAVLQCMKYLTEIGLDCNCVLLNEYRNEKDYISWHADDERLFDDSASITTVSIGETRRFQIRDNESKEIDTYYTTHGSAIVMPPGFQQTTSA